MEKKEKVELCKKYMHRYVLIRTTDGMSFDGIIENVDEVNVYVAVLAVEPAHAAAGVMHANAAPANMAPFHAGHASMAPVHSVHAMHAPVAHGNMEPMPVTSAGMESLSADRFSGETSDWHRAIGFGYGFPAAGVPGTAVPGYGVFGFPGYGWPGYIGYPGRFRRLILPLAALAAISLLPYY